MQKIEPKVLYVTGTESPTDVIYLAAKRCYSSKDSSLVSDFYSLPIEDEVPYDKKEKLIRKCIDSGHESVIEHASITFHITCSRACSHQLVRHRMASFSQQSQRYVALDNIEYITSDPTDYTDNLMRYIETAYKAKVNAGMKPEQAREILPNCTATHLIMTMNYRELLHFFKERCCNKAQDEIRLIANQMLETCIRICPAVFEHAGAKCEYLGYCPEAKGCGLYPPKQ